MNLMVFEYYKAHKYTISNLNKSEENLAERNTYFAKKKKEFKDVSSSAIKERDKEIAWRKADRKNVAKLKHQTRGDES